MALDMNNSPYLQPLPRANSHEGFSKHYTKRLHDQTKGKESLLKKIWSQVFVTKRSNATTAEHTKERAKQRHEKQREREKKEEEERQKQRAKDKEIQKERQEREQRLREEQKEKQQSAIESSEESSSPQPQRSNNHPKQEPREDSKSPPVPRSNRLVINDNHGESTTPHSYRKPNDSNNTKDSGIPKLPPIKNKVTFSNSSPQKSKSPEQKSHDSETKSQNSERNSRDSESQNGRQRQKSKNTLSLPNELANSPYLSGLKDRANLKFIIIERQKELLRMKDQVLRPPRPPSEPTPYQSTTRRSVPDYATSVTTQVDSWRTPRLPRGVTFTELEDRAKKIAHKAAKNNKIFTCEMPYPVDVFIRCSLRKREWVEKFSPRIQNSPTRGGTSSKLEVEDDEDFEAICEQDVPAPWEEDYGVYAMMSRLVRHYPARFIWGGTGVNSLVLKNEVIVNHFTKARYFSSKTGLTTNIRDLTWYLPGDPYQYFPRSYILGEDEKEDFINDFRLTVCMSILKWSLAQYVAEMSKPTEVSRDNSNKDSRSNQSHNRFHENQSHDTSCSIQIDADKSKTNESDSDKAELDQTDQYQSEHNLPESDKNEAELKHLTDTEGLENEQSSPTEQKHENATDELDHQPEENTESIQLDQSTTETKYEADEQNHRDENAEEQSDYETEGEENHEYIVNQENTDDESDKITEAEDEAATERKHDTDKTKAETAPPADNLNKPTDNKTREKVMPEIVVPEKKQGGTVPSKCVDWAISQCHRFLQFKEHEDIDQVSSRTSALQASQWESMYKWLDKIVKDGAKIPPVNKSKLDEVKDILDKMQEAWPQFDIDGMRNLWIVKPGAKSKGIGIEFHSRLEDMIKYADNGVLTGTYVVQKYIEQPLLLYNCKFDIRQWFLVTDWNPLTVWFYKDCYLRICSQEYNIDAMHEAVHLSNVSIQQYYMNGKRHEKLPDNNFMAREGFEEYLGELGAPHAYEDIICPGMKEAIIHALMCTLDVTESRKNAFELYGADFMISEEFKPWLLEINSSPGMAPQSKEKAKLCAAVVEDTIKVVLDLRENKKSDTGGFELIFKDQPLPSFKCTDNKLYLKGSRIRKSDLAKYAEIDSKLKKQDMLKTEREKQERERREKELKMKQEDEERKIKEEAEKKRVEEEKRREEEERKRKIEEPSEDEDEGEDFIDKYKKL